MARTDENYKVRQSIFWPQVSAKDINGIIEYLEKLKLQIADRDDEVSKKVNQLHVEYVTAAPDDGTPPDGPVPVLQLYDDGSDHYLYVYSEDGWHYVALTKL